MSTPEEYRVWADEAQAWADDYQPPLEDDSWLWVDADEVNFRHPTQDMCEAAITIKGEYFPCDLLAPHPGFAHCSMAAETIWSDGEG